MGDGEYRSRGDRVTKVPKSAAATVKAAAARSSGDRETRSEGFRLNDYPDDAIVSVHRGRKAACRGDVADQIGLGLRNVYDDVLSQPVPDRFFDLLRQLERVGPAQFKKDAQ